LLDPEVTTLPNQLASTANRRWIFLAFLGVLHLVFLQEPATPLGRLLFLSHIGLGLLWQPFVQPRRRVGLGGTVLVVLSAALLAYFLNWGLLLLWTMLLAGVAGGKVFLFPDRWERLFHLLSLGYLVTVVLALILPQLLAAAHLAETALPDLMIYLSPLGFLGMAALPMGRTTTEDRAEIVDFIYGVLVFLLLAVIVLGSLSFSLLFKTSYVEAVMTTLALVSGILLLLGFIWDPRSGFGGLGAAVAQHVMSLGLPVEAWLESLAELSRHEEDPDRFLALACAELPRRLPGVVGGSWEGRDGHHAFGEQHGHYLELPSGRLKIGLVTRVQPSPGMRWHYDLAARLLAEFYLGKWRAQELKRLSYIEAIHETGARLTHDVKNLLQSMDTLCATSEQEGGTPSAGFLALLRRQLPEISARLRQTLEKLSEPGKAMPAKPIPALSWLAALKNRYVADWLVFSAEGDLSACSVEDPALFSSIAENLLQNIVEKRRSSPDITAEVHLFCRDNKPGLEVSDTGCDISDVIATRLFKENLPSENGLGVGLYQCARLAEQGSYRLELAENREGYVRFRLGAAI
jgi:signal transduction histidine kinase